MQWCDTMTRCNGMVRHAWGLDSKDIQRDYMTINWTKRMRREAKTQRSYKTIMIRDATTRHDDETRRNNKMQGGRTRRCNGMRWWDNTTTNQIRGRGKRGEGRGERGEVGAWRHDKRQRRRQIIFWLGGALERGATRGYIPTYIETYPDTRKYLHMCRVLCYVGHDTHVKPKLATFGHVTDMSPTFPAKLRVVCSLALSLFFSPPSHWNWRQPTQLQKL